jgi:hypothetical protein
MATVQKPIPSADKMTTNVGSNVKENQPATKALKGDTDNQKTDRIGRIAITIQNCHLKISTAASGNSSQTVPNCVIGLPCYHCYLP